MKLVNFIIRSTITQIKICCCRVEDNTQQSPYSHFHIGILISWDNILVSNSQLLVVDNQGIQPQNPQYPSYPIPPIDLSHIKIYFLCHSGDNICSIKSTTLGKHKQTWNPITPYPLGRQLQQTFSAPLLSIKQMSNKDLA